MYLSFFFFFFFQAEDGIRDLTVTGVQTCALPIYPRPVQAAQHSGPDRRGLGAVRHAVLRPVVARLVPGWRHQLRERDLLRHEPERVRAQGVGRGLAGEQARRHRARRDRAYALMFKRVLIANRGEIALRVIRACKELDIETVAVYSEADRECLHVRFAADDVCIGRPPARDSYLNIPRIIAAAE